MDNKVFAELQNRGIVTNVGLDASKYETLEDLKNHGLATSIAANEEYAKAVEMTNEEIEEIVVDDNKDE